MTYLRMLSCVVAKSITNGSFSGFRAVSCRLLQQTPPVLSCVPSSPVRFKSLQRNKFYDQNTSRNSGKDDKVDLGNVAAAENWTEEFGSLSAETDYDNLEKFKDEEEEDKMDSGHIRLSATNRRHSPLYYGRQVEKLARQGRVQEAIDVVLVTMLEEDRVMPTSYNFTVLIGAVGRTGDVKMAFKLFNKMKKMGLQPEDPTYTALFNACANCRKKDFAVNKANHLRDLMHAKEHNTNKTTFHAMLKCYASANDPVTVFQIADEMMQAKVRFDYETFSFLLMGCIAEKEVGFELALQMWRRMRKKRISFDLHHYNLLIKAINECGVKQPSLESPQPILAEPQNLEESTDLTLPPVNILNPRTNLQLALSTMPATTPQERLAMIGGLPSLLSHMEADQVTPNIRSFTQLLSCVPQTNEAEHLLISMMDSKGLKLDETFINMLIRRRNMRKDIDSAKDVLIMMGERGLEANMMTFGCLAMGCFKERDANQILNHIEELNSVPSIQVFGLLVRQSRSNFGFKKRLLKRMRRLNISPNRFLLQQIEDQISNTKRQIVRMEMGKSVPSFFHQEDFSANFHDFLDYYEKWLKWNDLNEDVDE